MKKFNKRNTNFTSRPAIERMAKIHAKLVGLQPFNARTLAEELEVSRKTINRDIEFMRDRLGYDIEFCPQSNTFTGQVPGPAFL